MDPVDEIERLRQSSERDPALLVRLADTLVAAGRAEEAVSTCRRMLARRPDDVPLRLALGRALSATGNLEEAQAAMMDAVVRQKKQAESLGKLAPATSPAPAPVPLPRAQSNLLPPLSKTAVPGTEPPQPKTVVGKTIPPSNKTGPGTSPTPNRVTGVGAAAAAPAAVQRPTGATRTPLIAPPPAVAMPPIAAQPSFPAATTATTAAPAAPAAPAAKPAPTNGGGPEHFDDEQTRRAMRPPLTREATPTAEVVAEDIADSFPIETPAPHIHGPDTNPEVSSDDPSGPAPDGTYDLDSVARSLLASPQRALKTGEVGHSAEQILIERGFDQRRRSAFRWLWATLLVTVVGSAGAYFYRAQEKLRLLQLTLERAQERSRDATYDGDRAARDAYVSIIRSGQKSVLYYALAARAEARLAADHGEDSDSAGWSYLRRAEKRPDASQADPSSVAAMRQTRALLALFRGEPCTKVEDTDGDLAARCAVQRGEVGAARKMLIAQQQGPDAARASLALASLELGAGDTDAANKAVSAVLAKSPEHLNALLLKSLIALERGEKSTLPASVTALIEPKQPLPPDAPSPGPLGTSYYYLLRAQQLLADKTATDVDVNQALDKAMLGLRAEPRGMLIYARARLRQGHLVEAERAMRSAELLSPNDPEVAVLDAEVALAKGLEDKVATALAAAPELNPRAQSVMGRALVLLGKNKEGIAALDAALAKRTGDPTTIAYRDIARARLGDAAGADKDLAKYAEFGGSVTFAQGVVALERHDQKKAEAFLLKAADRSVESLRAHALLGKLYREQSKYTESIAQLERAVSFAPTLTVAVSELGRANLDLGRYREVRRTLRPSVDGGKASVEDMLNFAEASIALGFLEEGEKQLNESKAATSPRLERLRAIIMSWKGQKDAITASKTIEKLRKGPGANDAKLALAAGDIYRRAGNNKAATEAYQAAATAEPMRARLGLGKLAVLAGDMPGAETAYKAALEAWDKRPYAIDDRSEARIGLARALIARKALSDAGELLEKTIVDDPESAEAYYYLAKVLSEQGDPKAAIAKAERATQLDEQYADAFLLLGELSRSTDKLKAKQAYEKFLTLSPNAPQAKAVKKLLGTLGK